MDIGDKVLIIGKECRAIIGKEGIIIEKSCNMYTVKIGSKEYTVFENEMLKV